MKKNSAKFLFYTIRYGGLALIHILPIFLITYTLWNIHLVTNLVIYSIFTIFYRDLLPVTINYAKSFFIPLAMYLFIGVIVWALIIWPGVKKYFPPLYLVVDGVEMKEGRVWWRSPNRLTHYLKKLADIAGIKYDEEYIWLYRTRKLLNPFKPLSSFNRLYFPEDDFKQVEILAHIDILPKKIIFHDIYILKYRDGYILSLTKFKSEEINIDTLNKIIKEDSNRISKTVGDYALTNPELRVKNVSSALFWVPPANLEVKEHIRVGSESVGFETLEKLVEKYDQAKERALKDGVITPEEISNMLLPLFNQLLLYVNSMKSKFETDILPDPPRLKNNLITLEEMESYINEIRTAIATFNNPEVFR